MLCSFRKRPDHHTNAVEGQVAPLVWAPHLDVIGRDHIDHPGHFDVGHLAPDRHFLSGHLEFGEPGFERIRSRFSGASSLSRRGQSDRDRVELDIEGVGRGLKTQIVAAHRKQPAAPFASETAQGNSLPLVHRGVGYIAKGRLPPSLQLNEVLDLLGLAPEFGRHPTPEFFGEIVELLGLPSHLFRVLDAAIGRGRKVAATCFDVWGTREAG